MSTSKKRKTMDRGSTSRRYPAMYEKAVPIALIVIGVAITILLVVIFAVALGFFPGS